MRIDADLVRNIMLYLEKNIEFTENQNGTMSTTSIHWKKLFEDSTLSSKYNVEDIKYTVYQLGEANFIKPSITRAGGGISSIVVDDITWEGHEFLNNIRDDKVYSKVKTVLSGIKSVSINIISKTAAEILTGIINGNLGSFS